MMKWKRLVAAIDFSADSRLAMTRAAELARRFDSELVLLHVLPPMPSPTTTWDILGPSVRTLKARSTRQLEGRMAGWKSEAEHLLGRPVRTAVVAGDAAEEIVRFAHDEAVDVLVLGTRGRSGLQRALLGSVAEKVVRNAPGLVLVARGPSAQEARTSPSYSEALVEGVAVPP